MKLPSHTVPSILDSCLGAGLGWALLPLIDGIPAQLGAIVGFSIGLITAQFSFGRDAFRAIAFGQVVALVLSFRIFFGGLDRGQEFLGAYLLIGILLPALVVAFGQTPPPRTRSLDLPLGYEHVERIGRPWSVGEKLFAVFLTPVLLIVQAFSFAYFATIAVIPILFLGYFVRQLLRRREFQAPEAVRVLSIPSQREAPAQRRSQYTVVEARHDD